MNDKQLDRSLQSIGMACFVSYFPQFSDESISNEELIRMLMREKNYKESGCRTRVSQSRRIIARGKAQDALLRGARVPVLLVARLGGSDHF